MPFQRELEEIIDQTTGDQYLLRDPTKTTPAEVDASIETHDGDNEAHPDIRQDITDEASARDAADQSLSGRIDDASVQSDWECEDTASLQYIENKPGTISQAEIEALFIE